MNGPSDPEAPFWLHPTFEDVAPPFRPVARLVWIALFPLIACVWAGLYAFYAVVLLGFGISFYYAVFSSGPGTILLVVAITAAVAALGRPLSLEIGKRPRGRELVRHDEPQGATSLTRGRTVTPFGSQASQSPRRSKLKRITP